MIIGFLADIHEDIVSLTLALDVLEQHRCETLICLGDIVGFSLPFSQYIHTRNADACIALVRERCSVAVAGNHDLYAIRKTPQHNAGFDYGEGWYDVDYATRARKARNQIWLYEDHEIPATLSAASREFLHNLRETERIGLDGMSCMISHSCSPDFSGSTVYFPSQAFHLKHHFQYLNEHGCSVGVSGHGHPEGCLIVDEGNFALHPFGTIQLAVGQQWIVAPCVARTTRANGCLILDTEKRQLQVLPLNKVHHAPL